MSEDDLVTALRQPWVMIGGDAGVRELDGVLSHDTPHPRAFGTFPRVLCRYTRGIGPAPDESPELRVLTLEEAVRKMTGLPAARAGLAERGVLKQRLFADVVVFDPAEICDTATFENPRQLARGIRHVVVNGVPILREGEPTDARPGRGLRLHPPPPTE
jgi:dihydroorotase/N-acyl-D-amino-acid deacylase